MGSEVDYTIRPVEVYYKGYRFRSRLEARWAAFFDLCEWAWEYEPADFNGWFPDFVLLGKKGNRVYVEVKPIAEPCRELQDRIDKSGCPDEVLIVGLCPTLPGSWFDCRLGWLRESLAWGPAMLVVPTEDRRIIQGSCRFDFMHADMTYYGRITNCADGGHPLTADRVDVSEFWGLAHEMTRYDPS